MKVLIVGCGAVGLSLASALYASNAEVDLVARGETAEAIIKNGIERCGLLGNAAIAPERIHLFDKIENTQGGYDFIINSAKSTSNADIAISLAHRKNDILRPDGRLVLSQNGYGNEQAFMSVFHKHQIYHGSFAIGFKRPKPYISEVTVLTAPMSIGSIFGEPADACRELSEAIDRGGIPCATTNEIDKTLWSKLLYNCTLESAQRDIGNQLWRACEKRRLCFLDEGNHCRDFHSHARSWS